MTEILKKMLPEVHVPDYLRSPGIGIVCGVSESETDECLVEVLVSGGEIFTAKIDWFEADKLDLVPECVVMVGRAYSIKHLTQEEWDTNQGLLREIDDEYERRFGVKEQS